MVVVVSRLDEGERGRRRVGPGIGISSNYLPFFAALSYMNQCVLAKSLAQLLASPLCVRD